MYNPTKQESVARELTYEEQKYCVDVYETVVAVFNHHELQIGPTPGESYYRVNVLLPQKARYKAICRLKFDEEEKKLEIFDDTEKVAQYTIDSATGITEEHKAAITKYAKLIKENRDL